MCHIIRVADSELNLLFPERRIRIEKRKLLVLQKQPGGLMRNKSGIVLGNLNCEKAI
jgi:hypothetical protein